MHKGNTDIFSQNQQRQGSLSIFWWSQCLLWRRSVTVSLSRPGSATYNKTGVGDPSYNRPGSATSATTAACRSVARASRAWVKLPYCGGRGTMRTAQGLAPGDSPDGGGGGLGALGSGPKILTPSLLVCPLFEGSPVIRVAPSIFFWVSATKLRSNSLSRSKGISKTLLLMRRRTLPSLTACGFCCPFASFRGSGAVVLLFSGRGSDPVPVAGGSGEGEGEGEGVGSGEGSGAGAAALGSGCQANNTPSKVLPSVLCHFRGRHKATSCTVVITFWATGCLWLVRNRHAGIDVPAAGIESALAGSGEGQAEPQGESEDRFHGLNLGDFGRDHNCPHYSPVGWGMWTPCHRPIPWGLRRFREEVRKTIRQRGGPFGVAGGSW